MKPQNFPNRPITLVIPFAPGGSTSIVGRVIADKMSQLLGENIVIDNRPGADGTVGTRMVAKSEPDGYTLLLGYTGTLAVGPSLYKNVGYDPRKDFAAIGMIGKRAQCAGGASLVPRQVRRRTDCVCEGQSRQSQFGLGRVGSVNHITGEYFARFRRHYAGAYCLAGDGPALTDLLGGHSHWRWRRSLPFIPMFQAGCCARWR